MVSFSESPPEVIEQVIDALQDDLVALKACSQACLSLLPLSRKYLFQSIELTPRAWSPPQLPRFPRTIVSFGRLLDRSPGIAAYVRNLVYQTETPDFEDNDVPRILEKLDRVQNFRLVGVGMDWKTLRPPFRECLSNIIQSRSVTCLEISYLKNFPINTFIRCINLIDLTLIQLVGAAEENYEQDHSVSEVIAQLQSFTFDDGAGDYAKSLVKARRSNDLPFLDFSDLQTLNVCVEKHSDLVATHALISAAEKLETLDYTVEDLTDGFTGLAASMNVSSLSTLRRLRFQFDINDDIQDPLCGLCEELGTFTGRNVIEVIGLQIYVYPDSQCKTGNEWGRLDGVLASGFPKLCQVSLCIVVGVFSLYSEGSVLQERLNRLPEEQFPLLSKNTMVQFEFSTRVN